MSKSSTKGIFVTVLLSLAAHVAVITFWIDSPVAPRLGSQGLTVSMVVQAERKPAPQKNTQKKTSPYNSKKRTTKQRHAKKQQHTTNLPANKTVPSVVKQTFVSEKETLEIIDEHIADRQQNKTSSQLASKANEHSKQRLKSVLRKAFNVHFHYPRLAVRRGWQGEVQLGLRIEANGQLTRIRILQGSGYNLLDNAALNSLNKVELLPTAIALLNGSSLDLVLPVQYRLL